MPKIHPKSNSGGASSYAVPTSAIDGGHNGPVVFTVWRKSLLFNGNGLTVYDAGGNLVFRVDNYGSWRRSSVVLLMDAVGRALLTIRRKRKLTQADDWFVYDGEEDTNPRFQVKKYGQVYGPKKKVMARVIPCSGGGGEWSTSCDVEGSYADRCCVLQDTRHLRRLAEIKKKESVGDDVFRLVVESEFDPAAAMAIVVVLEQMFGSRKRR